MPLSPWGVDEFGETYWVDASKPSSYAYRQRPDGTFELRSWTETFGDEVRTQPLILDLTPNDDFADFVQGALWTIGSAVGVLEFQVPTLPGTSLDDKLGLLNFLPEDPMAWTDALSLADMEGWGFGDGGIGLPDLGSVDFSDVIDLGGQIYSATQSAPAAPPVIYGSMGMMPAVGGAIASGARTLAAALGSATAAAAARFTINGVTGTMRQLWAYTRSHGAAAVAAALGISVAALGEILLSAPEAMRPRRRRRGISARDIRTTKRVVGFVNRISSDIGCVRRPKFRKGR